MSDTPRTDALPKFVTTEGGCYMAEGEHADHVDIADCEEIERTLGVKITQLERALAAANARAEQNEKDAERYRWWRDNFGIVHDGPGTWQLYTIVYTNKVMTSPLFDAAIDAAIDAKENP